MATSSAKPPAPRAPDAGAPAPAGARSLAPLLELASRLAPHIPPRLGYRLCDIAAGTLAPRLPPYAAVLRNLAVIAPAATDAQRRAMARAVLVGIAKNYFDLFRFAALSPAEQSALALAEGAQHVERAVAAGRGALLVGPHTGSYTIVFAALIHQFNTRALLVVEQMADPRVHRLMNGLRAGTKVDIEPLGPNAGRAILRALHRNQLVILGADRAIATNAATVRFFGRPTPFPTGPATLALRTGAPLITGHPRRLPDNRSVVGFDPPLRIERTADQKADVYDATQKIAYIMQAYIRRDPAQWMVAEDAWPTR